MLSRVVGSLLSQTKVSRSGGEGCYGDGIFARKGTDHYESKIALDYEHILHHR
jgi:hypothetical protein